MCNCGNNDKPCSGPECNQHSNPEYTILNAFVDTIKQDFADEQTASKRIDMCNNCEFLILGTNCKKCGCFISLKTKFKNAQCPIGKW